MLVLQLREDFDCGKETSLDDEQCPHDIATLLKEYLRDLPDPLLCRDLYHAFVQTQSKLFIFVYLTSIVLIMHYRCRDTQQTTAIRSNTALNTVTSGTQ